MCVNNRVNLKESSRISRYWVEVQLEVEEEIEAEIETTKRPLCLMLCVSVVLKFTPLIPSLSLSQAFICTILSLLFRSWANARMVTKDTLFMLNYSTSSRIHFSQDDWIIKRLSTLWRKICREYHYIHVYNYIYIYIKKTCRKVLADEIVN